MPGLASLSEDPAAPPAAGDAFTAWDVLERFARSLQGCDQVGEQVCIALDAIQESLEADAVFWYPGRGREQLALAGPAPLGDVWCREFIEHLLADRPGSTAPLLRTFLDPAAKPAAPWPCSAALVCLDAAQGSWLGALSFHPRRIFQHTDLKIMGLARRMLVNHHRQVQAQAQARESLAGLVHCLLTSIESRDPCTRGHSERVARLAVGLGRHMGLGEAALADLYLAGLLHDVGKLGIRDSVLHKKEPLTAAETAHIQEHPVIGDRLLATLEPLQHLRPALRHHHERVDGTGYPDGLRGDAIPLAARILAVADAFDAMTSDRPYRQALAAEKIDAILRGGAGSQWDAQIIAHFLACRGELDDLREGRLGDELNLAVIRALSVELPLAAAPSRRLNGGA